MRTLISITLVLLFCSACGQTGKLYLPESDSGSGQSLEAVSGEIEAKTEAPDKDQIESELKAQKAS